MLMGQLDMPFWFCLEKKDSSEIRRSVDSIDEFLWEAEDRQRQKGGALCRRTTEPSLDQLRLWWEILESFPRQGHITWNWRSRLKLERNSVDFQRIRQRFWPVTCWWRSPDRGNPSRSPWILLQAELTAVTCAWDHKVGHPSAHGHISTLGGGGGVGRMLIPRLESLYEAKTLPW